MACNQSFDELHPSFSGSRIMSPSKAYYKAYDTYNSIILRCFFYSSTIDFGNKVSMSLYTYSFGL